MSVKKIKLRYDSIGDPIHVIDHLDELTQPRTTLWLAPFSSGEYKTSDGKRWRAIRAHYRQAVDRQKEKQDKKGK